jgi:glycosyltransferase involved in cell wall biosynthesis
MKSVVIITPTTGDNKLEQCISSVDRQTYTNLVHLVVADGPQFVSNTQKIVLGAPKVKFLPLVENTGANGYYGHRIFAAAGHLVNQDYIIYLDQDNWFDDNHVETMLKIIGENNLDWCYSLRKVYDKEGNYLLNDDCESLGKWEAWVGNTVHHIDTNCFCVKREIVISVSSVWHRGWGGDRMFYRALDQYFPKYDTTGKYTVNYRLGGNEGSVTKEFFESGNIVMANKYGKYPWRK